MYETLALYIDGEFVSGEGRKTQDVVNPATGDVLGQLPHATQKDLDRALAAAERLAESGVKVTRLAHGVPVGGELDHLDDGTLAAALRSRRDI